MPKGKAKPKTPVVIKFMVGDKVRVKQGIRDTDYPDMPLGGWAGTISEIHKDGMYTVRWSRETLAAINPVFKKRWERDGMALEDYWLGDDDLEPDTGSPLNIEHPTEINTKPLSPKDQDDRIRMIFGLTSNDPLPDVDGRTLETYHERYPRRQTQEARQGLQGRLPQTESSAHSGKKRRCRAATCECRGGATRRAA